MKLMAALMMAGMTTGVWAAEPPAAPARTATVCIDALNNAFIASSTQRASDVFATVGVLIDWRATKSCPDSPSAIKVHLSYATIINRNPGVLAYAMPFEGKSIQVLYTRVQAMAHEHSQPRVLAYVLVHEITHILQGLDVHSASGVMKACWDYPDFFAMGKNALGFNPEDVERLESGLAGRARANEAVSRAKQERP